MPLIIIVGLPSSGKTSRTNELKEYFERQLNKSVDIVSDINFNIDKNDYYSGYLLEGGPEGTLEYIYLFVFSIGKRERA